MRRTKLLQTLAGVLCTSFICSLLLPSFALARPANKQSQLTQKRTSINKKIRDVRGKLHRVKAIQQTTRTKLRSVEHTLRINRSALQVASIRLGRTKVALHQANTALSHAKREYAGAQSEASTHLLRIYERGEQGSLEIMLSSSDFGDLLQRAQVAEYIKKQDIELLDELNAHRSKVATYQARVAEKTAEVKAWQQRVAIIHNRNAAERLKFAKNLTNVTEMRAGMEAELAALERDSREVSAMLTRMRSTSAGKRRYNTKYAGPVSGLPVNGRITSPFGYRYHPVLRYTRLHTGVDIGAPSGTPIYSAGGGEVIYASRRGGYGNCVIIDHGRGKATLYGHMSSIAVRNGQVVKRRQMIGRVGSTGISTGPHLHYELRINGKPVNPL